MSDRPIVPDELLLLLQAELDEHLEVMGGITELHIGYWRGVTITEHDSDVAFLGGEEWLNPSVYAAGEYDPDFVPDKFTITRIPFPAEPARMHAQYACDDFAVIRENIERIRKEEQQMCPRTPSRLLHTCLRVEPQCPVECPHHNDWIGPNG